MVDAVQADGRAQVNVYPLPNAVPVLWCSVSTRYRRFGSRTALEAGTPGSWRVRSRRVQVPWIRCTSGATAAIARGRCPCPRTAARPPLPAHRCPDVDVGLPSVSIREGHPRAVGHTADRRPRHSYGENGRARGRPGRCCRSGARPCRKMSWCRGEGFVEGGVRAPVGVRRATSEEPVDQARLVVVSPSASPSTSVRAAASRVGTTMSPRREPASIPAKVRSTASCAPHPIIRAKHRGDPPPSGPVRDDAGRGSCRPRGRQGASAA